MARKEQTRRKEVAIADFFFCDFFFAIFFFLFHISAGDVIIIRGRGPDFPAEAPVPTVGEDSLQMFPRSLWSPGR